MGLKEEIDSVLFMSNQVRKLLFMTPSKNKKIQISIVVNILRYIFSTFFILAGLAYLSDSITGGLLILAASILFIPKTTKILQNKFSKYNPKLIAILSTILGLVILVAGLSIYSNSPSTKIRLEKLKREEEVSKNKANEQKKIDDEKKSADEQKQKADYLANLRFNIDEMFGKNISEIKQKYPGGKLNYNSYFSIDTGYSFKIKDYEIYTEWYNPEKSLVVNYITVTFSNNECEDNEDAINKSATILPTVAIDSNILKRYNKTQHFIYKDNKQVTIYCSEKKVSINYTLQSSSS